MNDSEGERGARPPQDLASLAKRYVELWQNHLAVMATDADVGEALVRIMAALALSGRSDSADAETAKPDGVGGTSAETTSRQRGERIDEFACRLVALEQRIAALETGTRRGREHAPAKSRGRRP